MPSPHRKVAEIADDPERIVAIQAAQKCGEAPVALGVVEPQVDIAGKVVRHGQEAPAAPPSGSESPRKRSMRPSERFSIRWRSFGSCEPSAAGGNGGGTGGPASGPNPEIGMGRVLARGMHLDVTGEWLDRVTGNLDGQFGLVALLAQMEQDDVPESLRPRERSRTD